MSPLRHWNAFRADMDRLPKMQRLWPPHPHIVLATAFTITLYIFLKCFCRPEDVVRTLLRSGGAAATTSTSSSDKGRRAVLLRSSLVARLLGAGVVALCLFTILLPMQRLAEMHVFVIAVNFVHLLFVCLSTAFFVFFYSERHKENLKEE